MSITVRQIADFMEEWAPLSYGESYDNPGLLLGRRSQTVNTVLVAVDASEEVIEQAISQQVDLLVTHHPLIFHAIKRITDEDRSGRRILTLIENKIALYSAHTNLDTAPGGNNDRAAALLGLQRVQAVGADGEQKCLRVGYLPSSMTLEELAKLVKERYQLGQVRRIGNEGQIVQKVALCTGSGMDFMTLAIKEGANALITGDITYHKADEAQAAGLGLIDATHFGTDHLSVRWVAEELRKLAVRKGAALRVIEAEETDFYQPL